MTYCVAVKLNAGLVFLSDSRTNAGLDHISTFRKMIVYERPGDRFMVLLSAGNLSISQSMREILQIEQLKDHEGGEPSPSGTPKACSTRRACWARPSGVSTSAMPRH
jgi:putative proteasome-type protease